MHSTGTLNPLRATMHSKTHMATKSEALATSDQMVLSTERTTLPTRMDSELLQMSSLLDRSQLLFQLHTQFTREVSGDFGLHLHPPQHLPQLQPLYCQAVSCPIPLRLLPLEPLTWPSRLDFLLAPQLLLQLPLPQ